jgi:hypothetical protein
LRKRLREEEYRMSHPDRKLLREKKRKSRNAEEGLAKKNNLGVMDLTPYNAVEFITKNKNSITYK